MSDEEKVARLKDELSKLKASFEHQIMKAHFRVKEIEDKFQYSKYQLSNLKRDLQRTLKQIEEIERREWTPYYAFLTQNSDGIWKCEAIINPEDEEWENKELPPATLIMRLPEPETVPEFQGF